MWGRPRLLVAHKLRRRVILPSQATNHLARIRPLRLLMDDATGAITPMQAPEKEVASNGIDVTLKDGKRRQTAYPGCREHLSSVGRRITVIVNGSGDLFEQAFGAQLGKIIAERSQ